MIQPTSHDDYLATLVHPALLAAADTVIEVRANNQGVVRLLAQVLPRSTDRIAVVNPLIWLPHGDSRKWVNCLAIHDDEGFNLQGITLDQDDPDYADQVRHQVISTLFETEPPFTVYLPETELEAARTCESLWPSSRTRKLRKAIENDKA
jgi:hypothetical protein